MVLLGFAILDVFVLFCFSIVIEAVGTQTTLEDWLGIVSTLPWDLKLDSTL